MLSEPQIVIVWAAASDQPEIIGDPAAVTGSDAPHRVLAFGTWLASDAARDMERSLDALRARGVSFATTVTTLTGRIVESEGQVVGGRAILRLREVSGTKYELAELNQRYRKQIADDAALRALIDAVPAPVWARDDNGRLAFANRAYARAVDAKGAEEAIEQGTELFDRAARNELFRAHEAATPYSGRLPAVVAGQRRSFDVIAVPATRGSAGIGIDATEAELLRAELARMMDAHRRTLDQLATGVAIFGSNQRLSFYNTAYRSLWDLDAGFLDHGPTDLAVLDQLRAARKLPDEQDFRQWKKALHEAYRAVEAKEDMWHLPDGRTLRVVTTPNPEGGVIYLFDEVTERLDLERRYDALIRVQGETLDNLTEAVAVFGSDGRLRLFNPVFARMWRLSNALLAGRPHIEAVSGASRPLHGEHPIWQRLRATITAIDNREPVIGRIERPDGNVVDCATMPLSDGAMLVTFQDVTDTVNVERALRERNEALEAADKLKIDFVHHVSYELRSPLTNIIGFAHFLGDPVTGPLTDKQREYLSYITVSTNSLLAIINNILDLATIDAGAMTLNLGSVDIRRDDGCGRRRRAGSSGQQRHQTRHSDRARHRQLRCGRAPSAPVAVQSARQCGRLLARGRGRYLCSAAAPGCRRVLGNRLWTRHSGRRQGQGIRLVRDPFTRLAPSRYRPWPVSRALLRRVAWGVGDAGVRGRPRYHRYLRLSARPWGRAERGLMRPRSQFPQSPAVRYSRFPPSTASALPVGDSGIVGT